MRNFVSFFSALSVCFQVVFVCSHLTGEEAQIAAITLSEVRSRT